MKSILKEKQVYQKSVDLKKSASKGTYSRIDRFYISESLQNFISSVAITPTILSDHSVVSIHVKCTNDAPKGPGFWRLNNDLLQDNEYVNQIRELILETVEQKTEDQDWRTLYDFLKFRIKQHSIKVSKLTAKKNRDEIKSLEDSIITLDLKLQENPENRETKVQLSDAQMKLETHYRRIERGHAL